KYMQGRAFLGDNLGTPREYVYAARDRMDEALDIIRGVRDKRYHYIRNYRPDLPYAQPIAYMDEMPTMKEWRRLAAAGKLDGPQAIFFQPTKPVDVLARLRAAHERWRRDTPDLALIPEADLNESRRPGGVWAVTANPNIAID